MMWPVVATATKQNERPVSLVACFSCGLVTVAALSIQFYATGGCAAARDASRRFNGRQVSDQMCCPVGRVISAVGLTLTALLGMAGVRHTTLALDAALGHCCWCCMGVCGTSAGAHAVGAFDVACIGLLLIGIFDLCWLEVAHAIGALLFFGSGYVLVGIVCCSRRQNSRLSLFSQRALKPVLPVLALLALPVTRLDALTAEWLAIAAVSLGAVALEIDIRTGLALLAEPELEEPPSAA